MAAITTEAVDEAVLTKQLAVAAVCDGAPGPAAAAQACRRRVDPGDGGDDNLLDDEDGED